MRFDLPDERARQRLRAEQVFVLSFLGLIALGTIGLKLIPGIFAGEPMDWIDALFTMTSAVCVTGLVVDNTATCFTWIGQLWIMIFIQLGGLGMIVLSSFIILALGGRMSLRAESLTTSPDVAPTINRAKLVRDVVIFTMLIETIGFIAFFKVFAGQMNVLDAAWHAMFHAVSAFCNAGFSTFEPGLVAYQKNPAVLMITTALVVAGGLGFLTMEELYRRARRHAPARPPRLSVHTKLVLWSTGILLLGGTVVFAWIEWHNPQTLGPMNTIDRVSNALFMSAMPRTAGFNAVSYVDTYESTNFVTILLMSIGGSPGSTAGGIKTTTFALVVLLAWSRFRRSSITSIFGRTIPIDTLQRAVGLLVTIFSVVTIALLMLLVIEERKSRESFLSYFFEAVSAFGTVGLSMDITPDLSRGGKLLVILLMFMGRVGPMTFAAAVSMPDNAVDRRFRYAQEDVVVG